MVDSASKVILAGQEDTQSACRLDFAAHWAAVLPVAAASTLCMPMAVLPSGQKDGSQRQRHQSIQHETAMHADSAAWADRARHTNNQK